MSQWMKVAGAVLLALSLAWPAAGQAPAFSQIAAVSGRVERINDTTGLPETIPATLVFGLDSSGRVWASHVELSFRIEQPTVKIDTKWTIVSNTEDEAAP